MDNLYTKHKKNRRVQIKSICRQQCKCDLNDGICFDRVENIMRKGENASFSEFSFFLIFFSNKDSFRRLFKPGLFV